MSTRVPRTILYIVGLLSLAACTVTPVLPIPPGNPALAAVQHDPDKYQNRLVTWGGTIIDSEVKQKLTSLVILAKSLDDHAAPVETDRSLGRFIARLEGFHDPAILARGRSITVTGPVTGTEQRKIDEHDYTYPVVSVERTYLWPIKKVIGVYDDLWLDLWFAPWYYPYWYPRSHNYPHHLHNVK